MTVYVPAGSAISEMARWPHAMLERQRGDRVELDFDRSRGRMKLVREGATLVTKPPNELGLRARRGGRMSSPGLQRKHPDTADGYRQSQIDRS